MSTWGFDKYRVYFLKMNVDPNKEDSNPTIMHELIIDDECLSVSEKPRNYKNTN